MTATKAELTAERERLAARLAEIDAQLARPVLPGGWNDPADPPKGDKWRYVLIRLCETDATAARVTGGWCCNGEWMEGDARGKDVTDRVIGWREIPADWLAPESREATEAEAMVKPVVKESLTAEPTTERLANLMYGAIVDAAFAKDGGTAKDAHEIVRRILAADHSVDLRGLWEPVGEKHKRSDTWLLHFADEAGVRHCTAAWWNCDMNAWCYACTAIAIIGDVIALADPAALLPAKLIGGGE